MPDVRYFGDAPGEQFQAAMESQDAIGVLVNPKQGTVGIQLGHIAEGWMDLDGADQLVAVLMQAIAEVRRGR